MTYLLDLDLDQQRIEQQEEAACNIYFTGIEDGYFGSTKVSSDELYLHGYIEGLMKRNEELAKEVEKLLGMVDEVVDPDCPF